MDFVQNRKSKVASINMRWPIRFEDSMATPVWLCNSHAKKTLRMSGDHHLLRKENTKEENMSERSVAMSWNTKRKRRAAAARMREMKKAKLSSSASEHSSEPTPSLSDPTSSGSLVTPLTEPTPSSSNPTSSVTVPSDDESSVHSESENERDGLESSNDEDVPDWLGESSKYFWWLGR